MKLGLITFFLIFSSGVYSKDLFNFPNSDPDVEKCIQTIVLNPMVQRKYPELLTDQKNDVGYKFLTQTDDFCSCKTKRLKSEIRLKKTNNIAWSFRDRSISLGVMDQCAIKHFSRYNLNLIYDIMVSTKMRRSLEGKLNGRMVAGVRHFASTKSIQTRNLCLQAKILRKCTKIRSLRSTYNCIKEVTSSGNQMSSIERNCPSFSTQQLDDEDLTNSGDMI
ncbi:MAG: hypothetical protein KC493_09815 [Bacteriovoracaceae bacterium]|nr:hypothetical protein [Bacteriovoracaceae bacterium]